MPPIPPEKTWIMRLKYSTYTVFLFGDPLQSIASFKEELLNALRERNPSGKFMGVSIPSTASEVEFGKPVDVFDLEKGWELIGSPPENEDDEEEDDNSTRRKSKGKAKATDNSTTSLKNAGFKEGVYAFRFKKQSDDDETMGDEPGWDVRIATFEDIYGVENQADLGVVPEYDG
jgi:hypothetical protein